MKNKNFNLKNFNFKLVSFNIIIFFLILYFIYHTISGERGVFALLRLKKEITANKLILEKLNHEKILLEHKVKLIHPRNNDLDMLDELARSELGLIASDEKVILLNNK